MASNTLTNTKISVTYAGVLHSAGVQLPASGLEYVYDGQGNRSSIRIGRDCSVDRTSLSIVCNGALFHRF